MPNALQQLVPPAQSNPPSSAPMARRRQPPAQDGADLEIRYDPTTGKLVSAPRSQPRKPDQVVFDTFAQDGFFADERVFVLDPALRNAPDGPARAWFHDDQTAVQVFAASPPWPIPGHAHPCQWCATPQSLATADPANLCLTVIAEEQVTYRWPHARGTRDAPLLWFPEPNASEPRTRGILDPGTMATSRIAIIGVGSGGSKVAEALAKAGVRQFDLVDPDRLTTGNLVRHACGLSDIGRYKVHALADRLRSRASDIGINVHTWPVDQAPERLTELITHCDVVAACTDCPAAQMACNIACVQAKVPMVFGRVYSGGIGGDVFMRRTCADPCLACVRWGATMEASSPERLRKVTPDYVSDDELAHQIMVGLDCDIEPIATMMTRLLLCHLTQGTPTALDTVRAHLRAPYFLYANRPQGLFAPWATPRDDLRLLRWYPIDVPRSPTCRICN